MSSGGIFSIFLPLALLGFHMFIVHLLQATFLNFSISVFSLCRWSLPRWASSVVAAAGGCLLAAMWSQWAGRILAAVCRLLQGLSWAAHGLEGTCGLQSLLHVGSMAAREGPRSTGLGSHAARGLLAPWRVESSWTRVLTSVPCNGRQILNLWPTRVFLYAVFSNVISSDNFCL